ncbi:uncharacterized protein A1O5_08289 [Cladophialophora psammophila CBS 110553]|uniref:Zn(2)-C6 fungal-type domain-containing protein n=1 Tax=Cladophialophora psammophila CBS 110553 TaxID=1182543 RepID=W9WV27_9EURO|nr:uncharacterized protein A1O5_08289 [Cladophialophora psammophila CBS 110553]EXJ68496.1 hypothetical protein A1O5_08289 [Cladophialophora psammophila CBS 110553]
MSATVKGAKSRSGCSTCKKRRVKCDEAKPSCRNCAHKNLKCPGYETRWKWSTKHERQSCLQIQRAPVFSKHRGESFNSNATPEASTLPRSHQRERAGTAFINQIKHAQPITEELDIGSPGQNDTFSSESEQALSNEEWDAVLSLSLRASTPPILCMSDAPATPGQASLTKCQRLWHSPDIILSNTQVQVDFFMQKICKALTSFDSKYNLFRTLATSRTTESLLFFSLFRYITAAFLNSSTLDAASALVVQNAQTEILHRLHNEVARLNRPTTTNIEDVLMAIIMYGLTTNWDGSNSPSIIHYNAAVRLYLHTYRNGMPVPRQKGYQEFFFNSLAYWWMGLSFITDTGQECLLQLPIPETRIGNDDETASPAKRIPHPLAGVSPESQRLLGSVGSLVYGQRLRCRKRSFPSMNQLRVEYDALQEAQSLEEEALSLKLPKADDFVDISDIDTPIQDLINTAEVYRLAALVLLYRAFPDLLNSRLRLGEDEYAAGQSTKERRLLWVTALAIHALDILCQNAERSGTRSIEQILLIIIGGELEKRTYSQPFDPTEESDSSIPAPLMTRWGPPSPLTISSFDHFTVLHDLSGRDSPRSVTDTPFCHPSGSDRIAGARRTLLKRLQSIREILPYRSLEIVQELVLKTWDISDNDDPEVFWMDIMIENGWKFLLV